MRRALAALVLVPVVAVARVRPRQDAIDRPTDTHVTLVAGLWHDDEITPATGWRVYHFTAEADGVVAFQMRATPGDAGVWSYLRVVDGGDHEWAGVGNRKTNLCEVIVEVERGHHYEVIATSQQNAVLALGQRQTAHGRYTIAALPVELP